MYLFTYISSSILLQPTYIHKCMDIHTYMNTDYPFIHTFLPTYLPTYIPTIPTHLHQYIRLHTSIHTYFQTFMHAYILIARQPTIISCIGSFFTHTYNSNWLPT